MNEVVVVIATKNRPELLKNRSLKSVLEQSAIINEVVVVQDYDEEYIAKNKRIVNDLNKSIKSTFLLNKRTVGFCGAANTGVYYVLENYSNPENVYIAILDDDDRWEVNYLSTCLDSSSKSLLKFFLFLNSLFKSDKIILIVESGVPSE